MKGKIIKIVSQYYYVLATDEIVCCNLRGKLRQEQVSPLVGDIVEYEKKDEGKGLITKVFARKNQLLRPPVANLSQVIVVSSLKNPLFDFKFVDKILVHAEREKLKIIICVTKIDLAATSEDFKFLKKIKDVYNKAGYKVVTFSIYNNKDILEVEKHLKDNVSVLAGKSGVGKTSLLQKLFPERNLVIGDISYKLKSGKHTTRHVELFSLSNGGQVVDTPGFSKLAFDGFGLTEIAAYFNEFKKYKNRCYFKGCLHLNEPKCAVKDAVLCGLISKERFESYCQFINILQKNKKY